MGTIIRKGQSEDLDFFYPAPGQSAGSGTRPALTVKKASLYRPNKGYFKKKRSGQRYIPKLN
jgi:hypothetical protein